MLQLYVYEHNVLILWLDIIWLILLSKPNLDYELHYVPTEYQNLTATVTILVGKLMTQFLL
jgi:hypothetical protein